MANVTTRIIDVNGLRAITSFMNETADWFSRVNESQEVFDRMMDDARTGSLVEQRKARVLLLDSSITDSGDEEVDEAVRKFLPFNTFFNLNNILLNAIPFGLSAAEVIWERRGAFLIPVSFVPIPRTALFFPGGKEGYMTPCLSVERVPLSDTRKFFVHRNDTGNGDRWGSPVLRRAYWPWKFKNTAFDAWVFAAKKIGVPSILAIFETKNEKEAAARAKDLVEALGEWEAGSSGALGNVVDLKVIDANIQDFNLLVETCNAEIAYAITGQSLSTNQAQYGTRAQSDTHAATLSQTIKKDAYLLQQTDQLLVDAFCALNFPGRARPIYDIDSTDSAGWDVIREAIDRGVPVSLKALYEKIKIPKPQDDADAFEKKAERFGFDDSFFFADAKPELIAEHLRSRRLDSLSSAAHRVIARSFARRIRAFLEEAEKNPDILNTRKTLPPSAESANACAALIVKSLLAGIDSAAKGNRFDEEASVDVAALPFEEAVAYLQKRDILPAKQYYALSDKARFRAFTVSRIADGDMLERVKALLVQNARDGAGLSDFLKKTDEEILEGVGLAGNGGGWYWENVYRTNVQTAYNAGRAVAFEAEPPVALELVGIGDARQTEICRKLTQPPVRRLYADDFWRTHWPPFHFGCRTTVRAIYDPAELEEEPVTGIPEDLKKHAGFGTYPTASGNWWRELKAMAARAKKYGVQGEIEKAKKILIGGDEVPEKFDYIKALEEQDNDYDALTEIMEQNTTDAEKQALRDWTSNLYERINNYLRKNTADEKAKELAERIQGALEKCDVPPMYVKRGVNLDYFDILSGSKDWQKKPGVLRGLDFRSEGFFATSPNAAGGLPAECMLYLKVPEGTKGAYIGSLSHYSDERELLLQEGTRFAIWDARKVKEGGKEKYIIFADIEISQGEI